MALTTTTGAPVLRPEDVGDLLVVPTMNMSVAAQVSTVVTTTSKDFRVPVVLADPAAQWVTEGSEITPSDANLDEVTVTPAKLAGLSIITRELADDSSPEAAAIVGQGLARDIARKLDVAFFGSEAAPAPAGLDALVGFTPVALTETAWADTDAFTQAQYEAEGVGAVITTFVANPDDALALSTLKEQTGSNRPLLQPDPTQPGRRTIGGVPLVTSPAVTPGTVWGLPQDRTLLVLRENTEVLADRSVFFTSDRVAVRGIMRVSWGFPHPASIVKITLAAV